MGLFKDYRKDVIEDTLKLDEAAFSEKNIVKVSTLVTKIMAKDFKGKFYALGMENFKSKVHGAGRGYRFINTKGVQLRFNWTKKASKKTSFYIDSVDYWAENNQNDGKPTLSIKIAPEVNIVQVVGLLIKTFKARRAGIVQSTLDEARSVQDRKDWLASQGMPSSYGSSEAKTRIAAGKKGLTAELEAFLGGEEVSDTTEAGDKAEKLLEKTPFSDPAIVFDHIETMTRAVVAGINKSLVVAGDPGIGKTHHVEKVLETMLGSPTGSDAKWRFISGALSTFALYEILFFNRDDKIIFFDDADDVWKTDSSVNVMKAALGDKPVRTVGWRSKFTQSVDAISAQDNKDLLRRLDNLRRNDPGMIGVKGKAGEFNNQLPDEFAFTSSIIFTSNKSKAFFQKLGGGAIDSRSMIMDIHLTKTDMLNRVKTVGILMGYSQSEVEDAVEALASGTGAVSIRKLEKAIKFKKAGIPGWQELAELYMS